ncbi:prepilin-type N-terminal cleavage/methylation domain-containing protein [Bacillus sp. FJAT-49711]|uniref:competence type IV pilus major pilin ComGC n=1 Tax=Bacillus sp. FJAT-49711 TaxID=2833585 RepID=UPI001BC9FBB0|nr:competence type IV pilus major pilin ComGC [Bacillus sp. FJAT-49711]MBS4217160.1 prepilin-type N-terminal cleavage/methylation domain-containing protein [Bacillus sp. FJAT-49711]
MRNIFDQNENGFTLIEMMIVLLVITIILLVALPNVTKQSSSINEKGCEAVVQMLQGQVQAYYMDKKAYPDTLDALKEEDYVNEDFKFVCPNGNALLIENGNVKQE